MGKIMADAGTSVIMHARRGEIADAINQAHPSPGYFPDVELPHTLTATTDPAAALDGAEFLVRWSGGRALYDPRPGEPRAQEPGVVCRFYYSGDTP